MSSSLCSSDFQYEAANEFFQSMDLVIDAVNAAGLNITAQYSTPSLYTYARHAEQLTWRVKTDDFFPYGISDHAYRTGFYTSRPALKRYVRVLSHVLQAARQLEVFTSADGSATRALWEALVSITSPSLPSVPQPPPCPGTDGCSVVSREWPNTMTLLVVRSVNMWRTTTRTCSPRAPHPPTAPRPPPSANSSPFLAARLLASPLALSSTSPSVRPPSPPLCRPSSCTTRSRVTCRPPSDCRPTRPPCSCGMRRGRRWERGSSMWCGR